MLSSLELFSDKIDVAYALIGHNISFDECIVGAEFERKRMMTSLFLKPKYCTMKMSTNYCKLPGGKQGFKSPKLSELHQVLFGRDSRMLMMLWQMCGQLFVVSGN